MKKDLKKINVMVMDISEKEENMQPTTDLFENIPKLPLPVTEKKRLMQAEVNLDLFNEVSKEMKTQGLKIRQVLEFGLKMFLAASEQQRKNSPQKKSSLAKKKDA